MSNRTRALKVRPRKRPPPKSAFKKGDPNNPRKNPASGSGRRTGTPNRFTGELKQYVLDALANSHPEGAQGYLQRQARINARSFMQLVGKLLPTQITGKDDTPLELVLVERAAGGLSKLPDADLKKLQEILAKIGLQPGAMP